MHVHLGRVIYALRTFHHMHMYICLMHQVASLEKQCQQHSTPPTPQAQNISPQDKTQNHPVKDSQEEEERRSSTDLSVVQSSIKRLKSFIIELENELILVSEKKVSSNDNNNPLMFQIETLNILKKSTEKELLLLEKYMDNNDLNEEQQGSSHLQGIYIYKYRDIIMKLHLFFDMA